MAGRVYLCTIAALVMATAHVKAFFLPPVVAPMVHPGLVTGLPLFAPHFFAKTFKNQNNVPMTKPLSRPFTLADLPGGNQAQSPQNGGLVLASSDGLFGNDLGGDVNGIFDGGIGNVGGIIGAANLGGVAASTNDLSTLTLTGAMEPQDARGRLEFSDSSLLIHGNGGMNHPLGMAEFSDSNVHVNTPGSASIGGLPAGSVMSAF